MYEKVVLTKHSTTTVSYTHLDVYKRQPTMSVNIIKVKYCT